MTENASEPTGDDVADGTQIPTADDLPDEEGDAGVGDAELDDEDDDGPLYELPD